MRWSSLSRYPLNTFGYTGIITQKSTFLSVFPAINVACESKWVLIASGKSYNRKNCKNSTALYNQSISSHLLRDTSWRYESERRASSQPMLHSESMCDSHSNFKGCSGNINTWIFSFVVSFLKLLVWRIVLWVLGSKPPVLLGWCVIAGLVLESQCHALVRLFGPQLQDGLSSPYCEITLQKEGGDEKHSSCPLEEDQTLTLSYSVSFRQIVFIKDF